MNAKILFYKLVVIGGLFLMGFSLTNNVSARGAGDGSADPEYNPRAEQWIAQQLNAGKEVDLTEKFPELADRRIRASFLVDLLDYPTQPIKLYGISISNATIVGDFSFKNRVVDFPVFIKWSTFEGVVELCSTRFHRFLSLQGNNFKSRINFCGIQVDDDVCLSGAIFDDALEFGAAHISGDLIIESAHFSNKYSKVSFNDIEIGDSLFLNNAIFEGEAVIKFANIGGDLQLAGAQFNDAQSVTNFSAIRVDHTLSVPNAVFAGGADFQNAVVGALTATNVAFQNSEQVIGFKNFHAESIFINQSIFNGPVNFDGAQFSGYFVATGAQFLNADGAVSFVNMAVDQTLYLDHTVFNGAVDFRYVTVGKDFNLIGSKFNNSEKEVMFQYGVIGNNLDLGESTFGSKINLGHVRTGISMLFNKAIIAGPLDLRFGWIGRNFEATDAQFNDTQEGTYFESMKVMDHILIHRAKFAGPVDFSYVHVDGLVGANDTQFEKPANFSNSVIGKCISINRAIFADSVNFANTSVNGFYADGTTFPQESGMINVGGLTYTELDVRDATTGAGFLFLVNQSPYNGNSYKALENHYRLAGFPAYADKVYINYKFRETKDGLDFLDWQWWWNLFLGGFIAFGKGPDVALFWFAVIIGFGWFMFLKKERMTSSVETEKTYRPLLYSLDLFLPFVNLGFASIWQPNTENKILRFYAIMHRYLGLILIPIAVLAFLGIIK